MDTITCPHCGMQNDLGDKVCVHCGKDMTAAAEAGTSDPATAATPAEPTAAGPTLAEPPPSSGFGAPAADETGATTAELAEPHPALEDGFAAGEPPKKRNMPLLVGIGVAAAVAILLVAFLAFGKNTTAKIPDSIAGSPRLTSTAATALEQQVEQIHLPNGMHARVAVYGTDAAPKYILELVDGLPDSAQNVSLTDNFGLFSSLVGGGAGSGLDLTNAAKAVRGGIEYICIPLSSSGSTGTVCLFHHQAIFGGLITVGGGDPQAALDTAELAYQAVT